MPSKNDLSRYKTKQSNPILPTPEATPTSGRKPKPISEKHSELVGLRFTPDEYNKIKKSAGLVPVATYLKHEILTKTDLLK